MDFFLLDENGPRDLSHEGLPHDDSGRFVHLRNPAEQKEYVVFASSELTGWHGDIVRVFCDAKAIETRSGQYLGRLPVGEEWRVGGGHWKYDPDKAILAITNGSTTYGPSVLDDNFKAALESLSWMAGWKVQFV